MATDFAIRALLTAESGQFQREFKTAAQSARSFHGEMKKVQQEVGHGGHGASQLFKGFKQIIGQNGELASSFGEVGHAIHFALIGGAVTGAVAGIGTLVDLAIRGKDATFGFAGAINVLGERLRGFEPDLVKVNKVTQEFFAEVGKGRNEKFEKSFDASMAFLQGKSTSFAGAFAEKHRQNLESGLPEPVRNLLQAERVAAQEALNQAKKDVAGFEGSAGQVKLNELQNKMRQTDWRWTAEEQNKANTYTDARAASLFFRGKVQARNDLEAAKAGIEAAQRDSARETNPLEVANRASVGARAELEKFGNDLAERFGFVQQRFGVGAEFAGRGAAAVGKSALAQFLKPVDNSDIIQRVKQLQREEETARGPSFALQGSAEFFKQMNMRDKAPLKDLVEIAKKQLAAEKRLAKEIGTEIANQRVTVVGP